MVFRAVYTGTGVTDSGGPVLGSPGGLLGCMQWPWWARWMSRFLNPWAAVMAWAMAVAVTRQPSVSQLHGCWQWLQQAGWASLQTRRAIPQPPAEYSGRGAGGCAVALLLWRVGLLSVAAGIGRQLGSVCFSLGDAAGGACPLGTRK